MTKEEHNMIENIKSWKVTKNLIIHDRVFKMRPIMNAPSGIFRIFEKVFDNLQSIGDFDTRKIDWKLQCLEKAGVLTNQTVFAYLVSKRINKEKV